MNRNSKKFNVKDLINSTRHRQHDRELLKNHKKLGNSLEKTISALVSAIERRDPFIMGHQQRVTKLACAIAKIIGLPEEMIEWIRISGIIHDIGKIEIPHDILYKSGKLTETEFQLIKNHPRIGYDFLNDIEFPWQVAQIVLHHHERIDGSGYPQGLSGEDILLEARILAVSDVVEAISCRRPYRPALGVDKAKNEIKKNSNILYDPYVVDLCVYILDEKKYTFES